MGKYLCGKKLEPVTPSDVGQQTNMYDCGIMVILYIEHIVKYYTEHEKLDTNWENYKFSYKDCRSKREELMKLVEKLHEEGPSIS